MLGAHADDVKLLRDFLQPSIQVKAVHEGLYIKHVWDVVLEVFFKVLPR